MRTNFGPVPSIGSRDGMHTTVLPEKIELQSAGGPLNQEIVCTQAFFHKM